MLSAEVFELQKHNIYSASEPQQQSPPSSQVLHSKQKE